MENRTVAPMLFPVEPAEFWTQLRRIIQEELSSAKKQSSPAAPLMVTPGLTQKPLYRMGEVCQIFQVSRPTIYQWVRHGKLKPLKIHSRVYFLSAHIEQLLSGGQPTSGDTLEKGVQRGKNTGGFID